MNMYVGATRNLYLGTKRDDNLPLGDIRPRGWDKIEADHEIDDGGPYNQPHQRTEPTQPTKFSMLVDGKEVSLTLDEIESMLNMQRQTIAIMQFTQDNQRDRLDARLREINAQTATIEQQRRLLVQYNVALTTCEHRITALEADKRTAQANASRKLKALQTQLDAKRAQFNWLNKFNDAAVAALDGVDAVIKRAKVKMQAV
jgi:hypothetical protein